MRNLEIKQMNELTSDFLLHKEVCDELSINITILKNRLDELMKELETSKEKQLKSKQALDSFFIYLVEKENRKQARNLEKNPINETF